MTKAEHRDALLRFKEALLAYQSTGSQRDRALVGQLRDAARNAAKFAGVSRGVDIKQPNSPFWHRGLEPIPNALLDMRDSSGKSLAEHAIEVVDEALSLLDTSLDQENPEQVAPKQGTKIMSANQPDAKKVFIIHGRNINARKAVEHFLLAVGLQPIDFDQLAADQGGTAFVGDIVRAGLEQAQGIIALFTPDEYSALRPDHRSANDHSSDLQRWQSRPNVIFEAGMAYGIAPKRTVLVTLGSEVSLFSDVAGVHILRLSNSIESRGRFRQKLIGMGCDIDQRADAWIDPSRSGDFEACIKSLSGVSPRDPF